MPIEILVFTFLCFEKKRIFNFIWLEFSIDDVIKTEFLRAKSRIFL